MVMMLLALALAPASADKPDMLTLQAQLRGLYEEISEAIMHATPADQGIDTLRSVLYTPDWEFIDDAGQHQTWQQASAAAAFHAAPFNTITTVMRKVTINGDTATVVVQVVVDTDTSEVDAQATKMPHPRDQTTTFRDTWVKSGESWKMKSRQQIGKSETRDASLY